MCARLSPACCQVGQEMKKQLKREMEPAPIPQHAPEGYVRLSELDQLQVKVGGLLYGGNCCPCTVQAFCHPYRCPCTSLLSPLHCPSLLSPLPLSLYKPSVTPALSKPFCHPYLCPCHPCPCRPRPCCPCVIWPCSYCASLPALLLLFCTSTPMPSSTTTTITVIITVINNNNNRHYRHGCNDLSGYVAITVCMHIGLTHDCVG